MGQTCVRGHDQFDQIYGFLRDIMIFRDRDLE